MKALDLTGHKFGRLTAIKKIETDKKGTYWSCKCECGNNTDVFIGHLRAGKIRSCGCLIVDTKSTHKLSRTPEHISWCAMRTRCYTKSTNGYHRYGGRGIKTCERWDNFLNFLEDMGSRPSKAHSIDRKDSNGDYTPENCKWSTIDEQSKNKINSRRWYVDGIKYDSVADAAKALGVCAQTIRAWCKNKNNCWSEYLYAQEN